MRNGEYEIIVYKEVEILRYDTKIMAETTEIFFLSVT